MTTIRTIGVALLAVAAVLALILLLTPALAPAARGLQPRGPRTRRRRRTSVSSNVDEEAPHALPALLRDHGNADPRERQLPTRQGSDRAAQPASPPWRLRPPGFAGGALRQLARRREQLEVEGVSFP